MAPIIRGNEVDIRVKTAATIAAASGGTGWQSLNMYTENFQPGQGLVNDDELGGSRNNLVDPVPKALALPSPSGSMQIPLDRNQLAFWLSSMFGPPVTTGASNPYTHTWTTAQTTPRMLHIEMPFAAAWLKMADAQVVSQMAIDLADIDGYRKADLTFLGRSVRKIAAAVSASPAAAPARDKIAGGKGVIKINGTQFDNILGGQFTIGNGAFNERYLDDSDWPGAVEIGQPTVSCTPEIRVRNDQSAMLDLFDGVTPFTFELLYQVSASQLLRFYCPWMIAPPVQPSANGIGAMSVSPQMEGAQKTTATSAPMCTISLLNATASYP